VNKTRWRVSNRGIIAVEEVLHMLALYIGERKVAWEDAGTALAEPGIDFRTVTFRNEVGVVIYRCEPVEEELKPLVVDARTADRRYNLPHVLPREMPCPNHSDSPSSAAG
jgi:hypothetical protein